jgi:hypothetical protein
MNRPARTRWDAAQAIAGAVTIVALVATGCTNDADQGTGPASPNRTSALTAPAGSVESTTTPQAMTREEAEAGAQAAVQDYLALFAEISADPDRDVTELEQVAADRALSWATHQITTWRDAGQRGVGTQVVSEFDVTNVVLGPDSSADHDHPTVELTACVDVSATDIVDDDGNSVVSPDRLSRALVDYVVWNTGWPYDPRWLVVRDDAQLTDSDPPEFVPCD